MRAKVISVALRRVQAVRMGQRVSRRSRCMTAEVVSERRFSILVGGR